MKVLIIQIVFIIVSVVVGVNSLTQSERSYSYTPTDKQWYLEYLPPTYDPTGASKSPVIIFLHGDGEISWNNNWPNDFYLLREKAIGSPPLLIHENRWPSGLPFVVLSLQRGSYYWNSDKITSFTQALPTIYPGIDPTRVYLTGLSGGGLAVYEIIKDSKAKADLYAALLSFATSKPMISGTGIYQSSLPCWGFWNADDNVVYSGTIETINYLNGQGICPQAKKTIFNNGWDQNERHDCWTPMYERTDPNYDIYSWMLQYTNKRVFSSGCTTSLTTLTTGGGSPTTTTTTTTGGGSPTTTTTTTTGGGSPTTTTTTTTTGTPTTATTTTGVPTNLQISKFSDPATDFCVVSSTDDVYKIQDSNNKSYRRNHLSSSWTEIGTSGQSLACTSTAAYVLISGGGSIYKYDTSIGNWALTGPGSIYGSFLIGGGNTLYYFGTDNTVKRLTSSNTFETISYFPPGTKFSATGDFLFALTPGGLLQMYTNGVLSNTNIYSGVQVLSGRSKGYCVLSEKGGIWVGNTPVFSVVGGPGEAFGVTKTALYGVGENKLDIYRYYEPQSGNPWWSYIYSSTTPITKIIGNGIRLYAIVSNAFGFVSSVPSRLCGFTSLDKINFNVTVVNLNDSSVVNYNVPTSQESFISFLTCDNAQATFLQTSSKDPNSISEYQTDFETGQTTILGSYKFSINLLPLAESFFQSADGSFMVGTVYSQDLKKLAMVQITNSGDISYIPITKAQLNIIHDSFYDPYLNQYYIYGQDTTGRNILFYIYVNSGNYLYYPVNIYDYLYYVNHQFLGVIATSSKLTVYQLSGSNDILYVLNYNTLNGIVADYYGNHFIFVTSDSTTAQITRIDTLNPDDNPVKINIEYKYASAIWNFAS
eukprot:gene10052-12321_t